MPAKKLAQASAEIVQLLHGARFKVKFANGHKATAYLSGKMRTEDRKERLVVGDKVIIEFPTNISRLDNGRIIERKK